MKIFGIILLGLCTACFGFKKAAALQKRYAILRDLHIAFGEAQQRMKLRQEKDIILERLFMPPFVIDKKSSLETLVHCPHLTPQDNTLLNEFTRSLGMGDLSSQLELLDIYKELVKGHMLEAKDELGRKAGVYRTCSLLAGAGVVILLI